jgi:hypothetical protein
MTTREWATVVGVFTDRVQADQAMLALYHAGFSDDEIGFATRHATHYTEHLQTPEHPDSAMGAAAGAIGGGVLGGVVGAAFALLIPGFGPAIAGGVLGATFGGAALGAATGSFMGAMTSLGLSEEDANYYQHEFETGRVIVTVKVSERAQEALDLLRNAGAYNSSTRPAAPPITDPTKEDTIEHPTPSDESTPTDVSDMETTPMHSYSHEAALEHDEAFTEKRSVVSPNSAPVVSYTPDSVVHHEGAEDRANRNNLPLGTLN